MNNKITLYPSNWLYNAGVIGFLKVIEKINKNVGELLKNHGSIEIDVRNFQVKEIFEKWKEMTEEKKYRWKGKSDYYSNQTENSIKKKINILISGNFKKLRRQIKITCFLCGNATLINKSEVSYCSQAYGNILISSERTFSNSYWNFRSNDFVCPKCEFIFMCHHLNRHRARKIYKNGSYYWIIKEKFDIKKGIEI